MSLLLSILNYRAMNILVQPSSVSDSVSVFYRFGP